MRLSSRLMLTGAILLSGVIAVIVSCSEDEPPVAVNGVNHAPRLEIRSPGDNYPEPTDILTRPTLVVKISDGEDPADELRFRWVFVSTLPYGDNWDAAEDSILAAPDSLTWSDWNTYAPSDTGMAVTVTDSLAFGPYVLAMQARDPGGLTSALGTASLRRVYAGDGFNDAPVVVIETPVSSAPDPTDVDALATFAFRVTDEDDPRANLSVRWGFVHTSEHDQDWDATEQFIQTQPDQVAWSGWTAWAPQDDRTMTVTLSAPLQLSPYVLAVQARDRGGRRSALDTDSMRRVRVCAQDNRDPRAIIVIPVYNGLNPASVPPITTIWVATGDDSPREDLAIRRALVATTEFDDSYDTTVKYLRGDPDVLAAYGKTPADVEAEWTDWTPVHGEPNIMPVQLGPLDYGGYVFAVQARDPCDAAQTELDEQFNVRRLRVSNRTTGPLLAVLNPYTGAIHTTVCNTPWVITEIFSAIDVVFKWTADASMYGGVVTGYRYGWDILDPDDDRQWEIDWTPFAGQIAESPPRSFDSGSHTFHVEVRDNSGFCSRVEVRLNIIRYAPTRPLLVVDDFSADHSQGAGWNDPIGQGFLPNDAEHDQFWADMLSDVAGFNPGVDVIEVTGTSSIPLTTIAQYKNIIWSVYTDVGQTSGLPLLYEYARFRPKDSLQGGSTGTREANPLALFMEAGGHVLITGRHTLTTTINRNYFFETPKFPFMALYDYFGSQDRTPYYENPPGDESFAYRHLSLETFDFAIPSPQTIRSNAYVCSVQQVRIISGTTLRDDGLRRAIPLDVSFPPLDLRPEAAAPGKAYDPAVRSYESEVYDPLYFFQLCPYVVGPRSTFEPMYGLGCLNTGSPVWGQPVAFWTSAFADRQAPNSVAARSAVFGFPLVYFQPVQVKEALDMILFQEWMLTQSP